CFEKIEKKEIIGIFWKDLNFFNFSKFEKLNEGGGMMMGMGMGMMGNKKEKEKIELEECIEKFSTKEVLSEENLWYCNKCKEHLQASKQMQIYTLPNILVIHLKRFQYNKYWRDKIDQFINFPIEGLDLTKFVVNAKE